MKIQMASRVFDDLSECQSRYAAVSEENQDRVKSKRSNKIKQKFRSRRRCRAVVIQVSVSTIC